MKEFKNPRVTVSELRRHVCKFAKSLGVSRVTFNKNGKYVAGTYNPETKSLYLCTKATKTELLRVFFHELGHHEAVKKNMWRTYHFNLVPAMTPEKIFSIENGIDQLGNKLWNKYVDVAKWGRYKYAYPKSKKRLLITSMNTFVKTSLKYE